MAKWISTSERLPAPYYKGYSRNVLVFIRPLPGQRNGTVDLTRLTPKRGWESWDDLYVTHWMPLPAPPRGP